MLSVVATSTLIARKQLFLIITVGSRMRQHVYSPSCFCSKYQRTFTATEVLFFIGVQQFVLLHVTSLLKARPAYVTLIRPGIRMSAYMSIEAVRLGKTFTTLFAIVRLPDDLSRVCGLLFSCFGNGVLYDSVWCCWKAFVIAKRNFRLDIDGIGCFFSGRPECCWFLFDVASFIFIIYGEECSG